MRRFVNLTLAIAVAIFAAKPAFAGTNLLMSGLGVVIGTPVSIVSSVLKGSVVKAVYYSDHMADHLGGGLIGTTLGLPLGFGIGLGTGAVTGAVKGTVDGITYGYSDPLTLKSFSMTGDFFDYDPYAINL